MRFARLLLVPLTALPSVASAQSMNAEMFYKRSTALIAKGPLAMFSRGEIKALMTEGQAAGKAAREQRLADLAAGKPRRSCPPSGSQSISTGEFMKRLGAIPAAERARINMTEAMVRITNARYPCPR
jgi:hypothetical protein